MSTHRQHLECLRLNYINAKNQYFNYINSYKENFWNDILIKLKEKLSKRKLRIFIKISKYFKKKKSNKIENKSKNTKTIDNNHTSSNNNHTSSNNNHTSSNNNHTSSNNNHTSSNNNHTSSSNNNNNIIDNDEVKINNLSDKMSDGIIEIDRISEDIMKMAKNNMYLKTDNQWCAFKNAIADIFVELSIEFNKLNDLKIITIQSRKIQTINKLLDLYKESYPSYKVLFSSNKELSKDLLNNMNKHPLIEYLINSFKSEKIRNSFIPLVNNIISI